MQKTISYFIALLSMCPQLVCNIVKIRKVDHQVFSYGRQSKVNGIEQVARCQAVLWFRPPGLQLFPQPFCQVQVGATRRQIKNTGAPVLPVRQPFFHLLCRVHPGFGQYRYRWFGQPRRQPSQPPHNKSGRYRLHCRLID